ncbi:MAG: NADP-dependent phosphogluconate dehydrogenase [Verrucomicrobia subdivision 3 bacterium]|nr:NADP-dependent phosphogluconate dehydrogenase [Limisphaerales bacterium]
MKTQQYEIGMVGLGVMGRNLLLNMADHGHSVAGYDKDVAKVAALRKEAENLNIRGAESLPEFLDLLRVPRAVMMLIPAGAPVDAVIHDLLPHLAHGDLIIDGGNSHFTDTDLRARMLAERGIQFLGVGVSGGEHGARHGPSIMPGGSREAYERVRPIFEAIAAKVNDEPCVAWLGPGSAGHYVKMVHNGIEYGLMRLIAEIYDFMKRGLGFTDAQTHSVFDRWNQEELNSYLVEITANIFSRIDEKTGQRLIDVILDEAGQKGTGMWASQDAMDLQVPLPTIDVAVAMRNLSGYKDEREEAARVLHRPLSHCEGDRLKFIGQMRSALYAGMIITYAQGMALLTVASVKREYHLNLETIARVWRGGCIIRAAFLEDIRAAFQARCELPNLLLDPNISNKVMEHQENLRSLVCAASQLGIPVPGLMVSLGYLDAYRSAWMPANLIQAQRDYFGSHTYERVDAKGVFHTRWSPE